MRPNTAPKFQDKPLTEYSDTALKDPGERPLNEC